MGDESWDNCFGGEIGELNVGEMGNDEINLSDELHLSQVDETQQRGGDDWGSDFEISEEGFCLGGGTSAPLRARNEENGDENWDDAFDGEGLSVSLGNGAREGREGDANCWDEDFAGMGSSLFGGGGKNGEESWDEDFGDLSAIPSSPLSFSFPPPQAPQPHSLSTQHRIFQQKPFPPRPLPQPSPLWSVHPFHSSESTGEGWERAITHHRTPSDLQDWFSSLSHKISSFLPDWKISSDAPPPISLLQRSVAHLRHLEKSFPSSFHKWMFQSMKFCCHLHWSDGSGSEWVGASSSAASGGSGASSSALSSPGGRGSHERLLRQELSHFFQILEKNSHLRGVSAEFVSIICHQMLSVSLSVFSSGTSGNSRSPGTSPSLSSRLPPSACSVGPASPEMERERHLDAICDVFCNMQGVVVEGWKAIILFHRGKSDVQEARERLVEAFRMCILPCATNRHLHSLFCRLMVEKQRKSPPSSGSIEALRGEISEEKLTEMSYLLLCLYLTLRNVSFVDLQSVEIKAKSGVASDGEVSDEEGLTSSFTDFSFYGDGDEDDSEEEDDGFFSPRASDAPERPPRPIRFSRVPLVRAKSLPRQLPVAEELLRLLEKGGAGAEEMCIALLFSLYPLVPLTSPLKPRIAYALGCHAKRLIDLHLAEKLLFEALFLMNSLPSVCGVPLLASDLGLHALTAYSEMLFQLDKVTSCCLCFSSFFFVW